MDVPLAGQLRIIHQGRFLEDIKALRGALVHELHDHKMSANALTLPVFVADHKVAEGETTAMHLIIKSEVSKPAGDARGKKAVLSLQMPHYVLHFRRCC